MDYDVSTMKENQYISKQLLTITLTKNTIQYRNKITDKKTKRNRA